MEKKNNKAPKTTLKPAPKMPRKEFDRWTTNGAGIVITKRPAGYNNAVKNTNNNNGKGKK